MARGNEDGMVKNLFFANPFLKKDNDPVIKINGKVNNNWETIDTVKWISGMITDIRKVDITYQSETKPGLAITLTDFKSDEAHIFRVHINSFAGRDLVFRLHNNNSGLINKNFRVKVYSSNGFNGLSIRLEDQIMEKAVTKEWIDSKVKRIKDGNKELVLTGELDTEVEKMVGDIIYRFNQEKGSTEFNREYKVSKGGDADPIEGRKPVDNPYKDPFEDMGNAMDFEQTAPGEDDLPF